MIASIPRTSARPRVLAALHVNRLALAVSGFGLPPRQFPANRADLATRLALQAEATYTLAGRPHRMSPDAWADVYWCRHSGPMRFDGDALRVYSETYAAITRDA